MHVVDSNCTNWHITFGTYGTRLHGGDRPTVVRTQNRPGQPFIGPDVARHAAARQRLRFRIVTLTLEQRRFIELRVPEHCERGGWRCHTCAAGPDHVHVLCEAPRSAHGKQIRALLKRWLTQSLNEMWERLDGGPWWSEGGSCRAVRVETYFRNAHSYIERQRAAA